MVAFAEAHLEPTVTQHRVDTHIHYNHQVGASGASSANASLHIEFCMSLVIKVQVCLAHMLTEWHEAKEIIVCVGLFPSEDQHEDSSFKTETRF